MFNLEMICADGIFQICDDVFSEKLTQKEAECVAQTFYEDLKKAESCIYRPQDISFNICTFWCSEEEKENILFNITIIKDVIFDMAQKVFDVYHNIENIVCPNHWLTFNATVVALIDFKETLFK